MGNKCSCFDPNNIPTERDQQNTNPSDPPSVRRYPNGRPFRSLKEDPAIEIYR
jgi:hypothetical protein